MRMPGVGYCEIAATTHKKINSNNYFFQVKLTAAEDRKDRNTNHRPDDTDDLTQ